MNFFLKVLLLLPVSQVLAQSHFNCGLQSAYERLFTQDPSARLRYERAINESNNAGKNSSAATSFTIPVVFHILHKGGSENISDAQVKSAIAILNRDFQKLNPDTTGIVSQFKNIAADCSIQFSLATIDDYGNCTNGITRHYDLNTNWTGSSGEYQYTWSPSKYLNIYVVKTMQNGAAGYTYLPGTAGAVMDAIVVLHNYTGNTGTASNFSSRTLTHEVGHWFNLSHTWGNSNNPGVACGDDGVSDTPITKGFTSCNLSNAIICTPGVTENVQNYMEYAYCSRMFTQGQKTRMHNSLNSATAGRSNLSSYSNLVSTGVINPITTCAPKAEFMPTVSVTCVGNSVNLTDYSYNAPVTSWKWSSQLSSNTSTTQTGSLTFTAAGLAQVKLVAGNSVGQDSITKPIITVLAGSGSGTTNVVQSFEAGSFPDSLWIASSPEYGSPFILNSSAAATGVKSIWVNNYYDNPNGPVSVYSPAFNLQMSTSAMLGFKYAYAQQSTGNNDVLKVLVSTNCGATWVAAYTKSGSTLNTTGTVITQAFTNPTTAQWKTEIINLTSYSSFAKVYLKFEFTPDANGPGNNIFIDDINFTNIVGHIESTSFVNGISVYPNPFNNELTIENSGEEKIKSLKIYDISSREIASVEGEVLNQSTIRMNNLVSLSNGIYFLSVKTHKGSKTIKLIRQ